MVLDWLVVRLAHLLPPRPHGQGGTPPLALEVHLDAVAAVLLDGLSYRRAGRMVGISKTEVGDSLDLLLGPLADLGFCQPDGTFITSLDELSVRLGEMAEVGEAVCVDGLATRVQRPRGWANQKVLYDAKRHTQTAQGLAVSTIRGGLLWLDGGWPGSCHEHELMKLAGLDEVLDDVEVASLLDRGFRGLAKTREHWHAPVGDRRTIDRLSDAQRAYNRLQAGLRAGGAVDRPSRQRLVAAPLARAAVPGPGRLPGRRRARLPWPLAPPGPHMRRERSWNLVALGGLRASGVAHRSCTREDPAMAPMPTLVLLHSPLVGPLTWQPAVTSLHAAGYHLAVPSLTGVVDTGPPSYRKLAGRVAETIRQANPTGAMVLIGHSGAGALLPAAAEATATPVAAVVFVDAILPHPGVSWFETARQCCASSFVGWPAMGSCLPGTSGSRLRW